MINKVNRISNNPLLAAQEEENEALAMEKVKNDEEMKHKKGKKKKHGRKEPVMETVMLE